MREKLVWFEREHSTLEATIIKLQQDLAAQSQQSGNWQLEINNLVLQIQQLKGSSTNQANQNQQFQNENANLKQQIAQLEAQLKNVSGSSAN